LAEHLSAVLPSGCRVLDVGTGDGQIAAQITERRPDLEFIGTDVLLRPRTKIPVVHFDGRRLPFPDNTYDVVMFVDVLHHTEDPVAMLAEAARVTRRYLVIKDHTLKGPLAGLTLRLMDWVGNARHGVALPFNYWTEETWQEAFQRLGGKVEAVNSRLNLYWGPLSLIFDRSLHFVARIVLQKQQSNCKASGSSDHPELRPQPDVCGQVVMGRDL
jgi:SAM-dependent methyltransferase